MTFFDDREKGFEAKYKHDQELQFKVFARRNKLLGLWAAQKLGLGGEAAEAYAKDVVKADFSKPGDEFAQLLRGCLFGGANVGEDGL